MSDHDARFIASARIRDSRFSGNKTDVNERCGSLLLGQSQNVGDLYHACAVRTQADTDRDSRSRCNFLACRRILAFDIAFVRLIAVDLCDRCFQAEPLQLFFRFGLLFACHICHGDLLDLDNCQTDSRPLLEPVSFFRACVHDNTVIING